jgi:16S rRNA (guanine966-N2)-methyltransferase
MQTDCRQAIGQLTQEGCRFDLIFMDPPYDRQIEKYILEVLSNSSIADSDTLIITEASLDTDFSYLKQMGYELLKEKKYKTNMHIFVKKQEQL